MMVHPKIYAIYFRMAANNYEDMLDVKLRYLILYGYSRSSCLKGSCASMSHGQTSLPAVSLYTPLTGSSDHGSDSSVGSFCCGARELSEPASP